MRCNAHVHRLDLGLYSHPKDFWENGVRTHVNSKEKKSPLPEKFSSEENRTQNAALSRTARPTHHQRAIPSSRTARPTHHQRAIPSSRTAHPTHHQRAIPSSSNTPPTSYSIKQDGAPNTPPTSYCGPNSGLTPALPTGLVSWHTRLPSQWLPYQVSRIVGSELGLAVPVSAYCQRVKLQVRCTTPESVCQHMQL